MALRKATNANAEANGVEMIPGKVTEEEKEDFKLRQRRRSSAVTLPKVINIRRASTVSTESWCK